MGRHFIQRPAGASGHSTIIKSGDITVSNYFYQALDGGHLATETVTIRKEPAPILPAPLAADADETATAAHAEATAAAISKAADSRKPFRFVPTSEDGQKRVKVARYNMTTAQWEAYSAETDSEKRAALLTGEPLITESNISPTAGQLALMRAMVDKATLAGMLASGTLIVPSARAEKAADSAAKNRSLTEAERTAAALDALFGPDPEPEPEPSGDDNGETQNADGENGEPEGTPEPTPEPEPSAEPVKASKTSK